MTAQFGSLRFLARSLVGYTEAAWRIGRAPENRQSFAALMSRFPGWYRSLGSTPLAQGLPWMSYAAIDLLREIARHDARVFEWGVGGSTIFFADRVASLVSVEHDEAWAGTTANAMASRSHIPWELIIQPPEPRMNGSLANPADPSTYASAVAPFLDVSFEKYARAIDAFPEGSFDIVVVDGRCRTACAMHGMPKVKPGGHLIIDDADRPRYASVAAELQRQGWVHTPLVGPGPCLWAFQETAAWQRPRG